MDSVNQYANAMTKEKKKKKPRKEEGRQQFEEIKYQPPSQQQYIQLN